jgi:hypothetical protein
MTEHSSCMSHTAVVNEAAVCRSQERNVWDAQAAIQQGVLRCSCMTPLEVLLPEDAQGLSQRVGQH